MRKKEGRKRIHCEGAMDFRRAGSPNWLLRDILGVDLEGIGMGYEAQTCDEQTRGDAKGGLPKTKAMKKAMIALLIFLSRCYSDGEETSLGGTRRVSFHSPPPPSAPACRRYDIRESPSTCVENSSATDFLGWCTDVSQS